MFMYLYKVKYINFFNNIHRHGKFRYKNIILYITYTLGTDIC